MRPAAGALAAALLLAVCGPVRAGPPGDGDAALDAIPPALLDEAPQPPPPPVAARRWDVKAFTELAGGPNAWRAGPVPLVQAQPAASGWGSLDLRAKYRPADGLALVVSDRLDQIVQSDHRLSTDQMRNVVREAYASLAPGDGWFLDLGRVNDKEGVATGFNPTDFFKTDAVVVRLNDDPAAWRRDRLGTVMARVQHVWRAGSVTLAAAPRLAYGEGPPASRVFTDGFDRTNRDARFLGKASLQLGPDFAPEALVYQEGDQPPLFGFNLTRGLGDRVVLWGEWSGGRRPDLVGAALAEGQRTGLFPAAFPAPVPDDPGLAFRSQAALGASLSFESKLSLSLEWDYNQAGLTRSQWNAWFARGRAVPALAGALWQIRAYALDAGEPASRNQLFLRADWPDFPVKNLELSGFVVLDPDASAFTQAEADYYLTPGTTLGLRVTAMAGQPASEWGSQPEAASVTARFVQYF